MKATGKENPDVKKGFTTIFIFLSFFITQPWARQLKNMQVYEGWEYALQSQNVQGSQSLHNYTGCRGLPALFGCNGNLANFPLA